MSEIKPELLSLYCKLPSCFRRAILSCFRRPGKAPSRGSGSAIRRGKAAQNLRFHLWCVCEKQKKTRFKRSIEKGKLNQTSRNREE